MRPTFAFFAVVVAFISEHFATPGISPATLDSGTAANGEPEEPAQATSWPDQLSGTYGQIDVTSVPAPVVEDEEIEAVIAALEKLK